MPAYADTPMPLILSSPCRRKMPMPLARLRGVFSCRYDIACAAMPLIRDMPA